MKNTTPMSLACVLALSACASPSCPPAVSPADYQAPAFPALNRAAAHAQLDPAAAADLATITHEGDASIRELNYCIAQYNAVKDAHDAWRLKLEGMAHAQTP